MKKFLGLVIVTIFGWVGWKLGVQIGLMTAYFVSGLASIVGVVVAWKVDRMLSE